MWLLASRQCGQSVWSITVVSSLADQKLIAPAPHRDCSQQQAGSFYLSLNLMSRTHDVTLLILSQYKGLICASLNFSNLLKHKVNVYDIYYYLLVYIELHCVMNVSSTLEISHI